MLKIFAINGQRNRSPLVKICVIDEKKMAITEGQCYGEEANIAVLASKYGQTRKWLVNPAEVSAATLF